MTRVSIDDAFARAQQLHAAAQASQAEQLLRQILAQQPNHSPSLRLLGTIAFDFGHHAPALELLQRALTLDRQNAELQHNVATVLALLGRTDEAIAGFRRTVALAPALVRGHYDLGNLLQSQGAFDEALQCFAAALRLDPNHGPSHNAVGTTEMYRGHFAAAETSLRRAVETIENVAIPHSNLGLLYLAAGRINQAIASTRAALAVLPEARWLWSNLLFALQYHPTISSAELLREHQHWAERMTAPLARSAAPLGPIDRSPTRKLRIAYVSADLHEHPVAFFIEPILRNHDRGRFEVFCYAQVPTPDAVTLRLRSLVDRWRTISDADSDERLAQIIREDRIDILVDLAAHTAHNRLLAFARRAAPVQMTYLAYAATTGLPAMDYRITDATIDPPGSETHGTEKLIRLDRVFCCYQPPANVPVAPLPASTAGHITFGALCTLAKVNESVIALWARVLHAVPDSRLLVRARGLDDEARRRLQDAFAQHHIAADRLQMHNHAPLAAYLQTFSRVDIALDPFPFSAHTTTCHALWMGVPVVTLAGERSVSRVSASVLASVNLGELTATSERQYIEIAANLAADLPRLSKLRATLRQTMQSSPLMDAAGITRKIESAFCAAWETWTRSPNVDALIAGLRHADKLLSAGRADQAEPILADLAARWRNQVEPHNNLANAFVAQGKYPQAIASAKRAIAVAPDLAEPYNVLGNAFQLSGNFADAITAYEQAIARAPGEADAHNNLASALSSLGQYTRAAEEYTRATQLQPDHALAFTNLGNVLHTIGRQREAIDAYRQAIRARPDFFGAASCLLFALNSLDDIDPQSIFREHQEWARIHASSIRAYASHANTLDPARPLRVGFVSPDLRHHPVGRFLLPLLREHDKSKIEITFYCNTATEDAMTADLRKLCDRWVNTFGRNHADVATAVHAHQIDILIDLAGHTSRPQLPIFAQKPAPIQATYLGYPNTTGLPQINYRITDALADPPGQTESLHTETLLRLPDCAWCFDPPPDAAPVAPLPAQSAGHITFGSFNNFAKVSPTAMKLWARVLDANHGSRLLIKAIGIDEPLTQQHIRRRLVDCGIDSARVDILGRVESFAEHLRLYERVDIALDTYPYHGTTTTCEALWMGVPVITLAGGTHVSRVGVSLLSAAGFPQWIADDPDQYIAIARSLAADLPRLAALRTSLRDRLRMSPLCNAPTFARHFETAMRNIWNTWLDRRRGMP